MTADMRNMSVSNPKIFYTTIVASIICVMPAIADTELDELQARYEKAKKANLRLKTEILERENVALKDELQQKSEQKRASSDSNSSLPGNKLITNEEIIISEGKKPPAAIVIKDYRKAILFDKHNSNRNFYEEKGKTVELEQMLRADARREYFATTSGYAASPIIQQWSGVYVGINGGYGRGSISSYTQAYIPGGNSTTYTNQPNIPNESSTTQQLISNRDTSFYEGPVVGAQIGYNYISGNKFLAGIEMDMNYADIRNQNTPNLSSSTITNSNGNRASSSIALSEFNNRLGLDWVGTVRTRFGYTIENFMPYMTAGLAYGGITNQTFSGFLTGNTNTYSLPSNLPRVQTLTDRTLSTQIGNTNSSTVRTGWAAGAGAEYKVANNFSIKGEYLYTSIGGIGSNSNSKNALYGNFINSFPPDPVRLTEINSTSAGIGYGSTGSFGIHQVRIGLNYYTGWLGSK